MGRRTYFGAENMTMSTGSVLAGLQTAAAGANAAQITKITRVEITQNGSAAIAMCRAVMSLRNSAGTLTMTATTPQPSIPGGAASGFTGSTNILGGTARTGTASSADSGGTYTDYRPFNFANLNGYLWKPDPDEPFVIPPSTIWVVRFLAAPGTLTGWTVLVDLDEL